MDRLSGTAATELTTRELNAPLDDLKAWVRGDGADPEAVPAELIAALSA